MKDEELSENITVDYVINRISDGELDKKNTPKRHWSSGYDLQEFMKMLMIWLACGVTIFIVLIVIEMLNDPEDLIRNVVMRTDTISLVFSLVLSAALEQIWNGKDNVKYRVSQVIEIMLAAIGLILYTAYSFMEKLVPENSYYTGRMWVNIVYIISSILCVIFGFLMRSKKDEGRMG